METASNTIRRTHRTLAPDALALLEEFRTLSDTAAVLVNRADALRHDWQGADDLGLLELLDEWVDRAGHLTGPPSGAYDPPDPSSFVACPLPGYFVG